jgi:hypothetical protein
MSEIDELRFWHEDHPQNVCVMVFGDGPAHLEKCPYHALRAAVEKLRKEAQDDEEGGITGWFTNEIERRLREILEGK